MESSRWSYSRLCHKKISTFPQHFIPLPLQNWRGLPQPVHLLLLHQLVLLCFHTTLTFILSFFLIPFLSFCLPSLQMTSVEKHSLFYSHFSINLTITLTRQNSSTTIGSAVRDYLTSAVVLEQLKILRNVPPYIW